MQQTQPGMVVLCQVNRRIECAVRAFRAIYRNENFLKHS
jgi:hypothetical protein